MKRSSARGGLMAIMSGTAVGQVVTFAAAPILSRLFTPEAFGIFSLISSVAIVLGNASSLRIEAAIPLPRDSSSAFSLVGAGAIIGALISASLLIALVASRDLVGSWTAQPDLARWLWLAPALAATLSWYLVLNALAIRQRRYSAIGLRNVIQAISTAGLQILAGIAGGQAGGLVMAAIAGQLVGVVSLLVGSGILSPEATQGLTRGRIKKELRQYRSFLSVLAPAGLLNNLGLQIPIMLIGTLYGVSAAGWFGLTQRVLAVPVALAGQAAAQVFLSELAHSKREQTGRQRALFWDASKRLMAIGTAIALTIAMLAPWTFTAVFGEAWTESGLMAQAMSLAVLGQLVASPVSQTLIVYGRVGIQLLWDAGRVLTISGALLVTWRLGFDLVTAVWAYAGTSFILYAISWELSRKTLEWSRASP